MNKDFFINNRKNIIDNLEDDSVLVLFSGSAPQRSADQGYKYTVNRNFYYLAGVERENFILLITKRNSKVEEILFIEEVNPDIEKWIGIRMRKEEAQNASGIEKIQYVNGFKDFFSRLLLVNSFENLYVDLEKRGWDELDTLGVKFAKESRDRYPYLNIKNIHGDIAQLRVIKSDEEVEKISKAVEITGEGIKSIMENLKPGVKEYQLEAHFDFTIKSLGAQDNAFKTIAASGENAVILHYVENKNEAKNDNLILFDLGAEYDNYCADISRTFPVNGKFTERQKQIYNIVLKAMEETISAVKPGLPFTELNKITTKVLTEECKKIGLIKEDSEIKNYYYHGVSHFLGLDTHDVGNRDVKLEPGMIFTVEPGLYIADEGIGIRIEDDILVTEDGYKNLSKDIIKSVEEIEDFMNR
ncbi:MAG: aminopeptidase P family protein [Firmicutes bacterium]|nr:aminopeptidase P family protein [Bacillota bacterium]